MIPKTLKPSAGQALVAVLFITLLTVLLGAQTIASSWTGLFAAETSATALSAAAAAEGAIDFAVAALNATIPDGPSNQLTALPVAFVTDGPNLWRYDDPANGSVLSQALDDSVQSLTIAVPSQVPVTGGTGSPSDYRLVTAVARASGRTREVRAIVGLARTAVTVEQAVFPRAITSDGDLIADGTDSTIRTDSYRGSDGPYGDANRGDAGGVHTNGSVIGGGVYRGSVSAVGTIDAHVTVQGAGNAVLAAAAPETIAVAPPPPVAVPLAWTAGSTVSPLANTVVGLGDVALSGHQTLTLQPGVYLLDSLQLSGGASLIVSGGGRTTLTVTGAVDVTGNGIVTTSHRPLDLLLIASGSGAPVHIAGNGTFYGLLQAPGRPVVLGGQGIFFGAVVGGRVTFNGSNSTVHYDEDAATVARSTVQIDRPVRFRVLAVDLPNRS